ncbi:MAG TPA: RNA polymerase sigma factor [Candidatus Limnocylindrales bacterium]
MLAELVARAQRGDREAFSTLASGVSARLYATARLILRHPDRAEDAVQDTLVEAWRDIRGLRDPDRLDAWLHRLLVRACHRHARRDQRRRVSEIAVPDLESGGASPAVVATDIAAALADRDEMERAFRRLTDDQRTLLALIYYADRPLVDVAMAMGIPVGTAKSRHHRAMAALRAALAADDRTPQLVDGQPA